MEDIQDFFERFMRGIRCCLCRCVMVSPCQLACCHSFCKECLKILIFQDVDDKEDVKVESYLCLSCGETTAVKDVVENQFLRQLTQRYDVFKFIYTACEVCLVTSTWFCVQCTKLCRRTNFCDQCQYSFCQSCFEYHLLDITRHNHKMLAIRTPSRKASGCSYCPRSTDEALTKSDGVAGVERIGNIVGARPAWLTPEVEAHLLRFTVYPVVLCARNHYIDGSVLCTVCDQHVCMICDNFHAYGQHKLISTNGIYKRTNRLLEKGSDYIVLGLKRRRDFYEQIREAEENMEELCKNKPDVEEKLLVKCNKDIEELKKHYEKTRSQELLRMVRGEMALSYIDLVIRCVNQDIPNLYTLVVKYAMLERRLQDNITALKSHVRFRKAESFVTPAINYKEDPEAVAYVRLHTSELIETPLAMYLEKLKRSCNFLSNHRLYSDEEVFEKLQGVIMYLRRAWKIDAEQQSFLVDTDKWCICEVRNGRLNFEFSHFRLGTIKHPRAIQFITKDRSVVAGERGLYVVNAEDSEITDKLDKGVFGKGLWVHKGVIRALKVDTSKMFVYHFDEVKGKKVQRSTVYFPRCKFQMMDTLAANEKHLIICHFGRVQDDAESTLENHINIYSLDGTLVSKVPNCSPSAVQFQNPMLVGISESDRLLIIDNKSSKVYIWSDQRWFLLPDCNTLSGMNRDLMFKYGELWLLQAVDESETRLVACTIKKIMKNRAVAQPPALSLPEQLTPSYFTSVHSSAETSGVHLQTPKVGRVPPVFSKFASPISSGDPHPRVRF